MWRRGQIEVEAFGRRMVDALEANADKGSWEGMNTPEDWRFWQAKITEEYVELMVELRRAERGETHRVAPEATDLANVSLMACSNAGGLEHPPEGDYYDGEQCTALNHSPGMTYDPLRGERCILQAGHHGPHMYHSGIPKCAARFNRAPGKPIESCVLKTGHDGPHAWPNGPDTHIARCRTFKPGNVEDAQRGYGAQCLLEYGHSGQHVFKDDLP